MSMLNKWDYSGVDEVCYSDANEESYKKAAAFLGKDEPMEDWGGGTGWARRYFTNYKNIDGSPHKYVDVIADLVTYTSRVDNILLRQTLECNVEWLQILNNAFKSFRKKLCIVIMTPDSSVTEIGCTEPSVKADGTIPIGDDIYMIFFNRQALLNNIVSSKYKVTEEVITTNQGYGRDWIIYIERI